MIESHYWRAALREDMVTLRRLNTFARWSEKRQVLFERQLILVACQIRTLLDHFRINAAFARRQLHAQFNRKVGSTPVTRLNALDLIAHFDWSELRYVRMPVRDVCNQLIHHYVLLALRSRGAFTHVAVFSDRTRNTGLYVLDVAELLQFFAGFAEDGSASSVVRFRWHESKHDYSVTT